MMGKLQIIHTDGDDLVVIPRRDYDALLARLAMRQAKTR